MVWLAVSAKGISESYIYRNKNALSGNVYLNQCVKSKLFPFIKKFHSNPPNIPQGRPIEDFWSILAQQVYEQNWEAKTTKQVERRIRKKLKQIDGTVLQHMMEDVRKNLRKMYAGGVFSVCH